MSWSEVAECFGTTFGKVYRAVKWIVDWGLQHRHLDSVESLGVDEVQVGKGHQYATLVYQIDAGNKRLLLTKSKYIFLKNPENLPDDQATKLSELLGTNLRVVRAYLM
jgi:transposase